MIEAQAEIDIDAPVERVFDYVADARHEPEWMPGAKDVRKLSPGDVGAGTRFEGHYAGAGRIEVEIVAFDRPRALTVRGRSRIVHFDDALEFVPTGSGTRLKAHLSAEPQGLMRLVTPLMGRAMRSQFVADWPHLKHVLES